MKLKAAFAGEHHGLWLKVVSAVSVPSAAHPLPAGTTRAVCCVYAATGVLGLSMKVHQRVSWWPVSGSCAVPCPLEHFASLPLARRAATCPEMSAFPGLLPPLPYLLAHLAAWRGGSWCISL